MGHKDYSLATGGMPRNAMIIPVGSLAVLTPASNTAPHEVIVPRIQITKIPQAMRSMGWSVSASLMERWFESAAWQLPAEDKDEKSAPNPLDIPAVHVDERLVTMAWALRFDRCKKAVRELANRWNSPSAVELLVKKLTNAGWDMRSDFHLGDDRMSARQLEAHSQINFARFGSAADTLDDFYGAIGSTSLKVAIIGRACTVEGTGHRVFHATRCGFYLKDHYDFNGLQYLGLWTENGALGKAAMVGNSLLDGRIYEWHGEGVGHVYNAHFQQFREENNRGGDFHVYSDVHWTPVTETIDLERAIAARLKK
jgi:hypothetical protein